MISSSFFIGIASIVTVVCSGSMLFIVRKSSKARENFDKFPGTDIMIKLHMRAIDKCKEGVGNNMDSVSEILTRSGIVFIGKEEYDVIESLRFITSDMFLDFVDADDEEREIVREVIYPYVESHDYLNIVMKIMPLAAAIQLCLILIIMFL